MIDITGQGVPLVALLHCVRRLCRFRLQYRYIGAFSTFSGSRVGSRESVDITLLLGGPKVRDPSADASDAHTDFSFPPLRESLRSAYTYVVMHAEKSG